jgi:UDP-glucose:(heptosyl)LPS alpha-1,3-glucosyltransferase
LFRLARGADASTARDLKIGLILERFDPERGGLEHWAWQFARSLTARGHEVHVVAFEFHPDAADLGIVKHWLDEMPRSRIARAETIAARLPALGLEIVHDNGIGWEADIIHPHAGSTKALWEHNLMRIPKWRQIRFWRERRYRELEEIERRQHQNSRAVIVPVSRMVQQNFETLHRLPPDRMRVIYNGVDVARFTPAVRETLREQTRRELGVGGEVLFLMLAHNLLLKNAEALIRAAAKMKANGKPIRVVIAGGKKADRFVKLASKLHVSDVVSFRGLVDPLPYYAAADVFVHPTWYDPCSLVTLEAAACGLPVITTRYNGASELMEDRVDGYVLEDPHDIAALASRMEALLDPAQRVTMGAAAREMALQHTFERQTDEFLALYGEILRRKAA